MVKDETRAAIAPNPEDWTDIEGAAAILGKSRATIYALVDAGALTQYRIGAHRCLWRAEVQHVADAYRALRVRRG